MISIKWGHVAGTRCEMQCCSVITTEVTEVFWIISWAEVNEIAKSFIYDAEFFIWKNESLLVSLVID